MKLHDLHEGFPNRYTPLTGKRDDVKRGPQYTTAELARAFDMTIDQLTGMRIKYPGFPEPSGKHAQTTGAGNRVYYDFNLAKRWFIGIRNSLRAQRQELEAEVAQRTQSQP